MKNTIKLISSLLAVIMMLSSFSVLFTVNAFADETAATEKAANEEATGTGTDAGTDTETETGKQDSNKQEIVDPEKLAEEYLSAVYPTPEDRLAAMAKTNAGKPNFVSGDYEIYVDSFSGEVACRNTKTNEIIFTNPYDVGTSTGVADTKYELLSQLMVEFTDNQGQTKVFNSFEQSAIRQQINVEPIKGGVRVEYTIGREQAKTLVPRLISQERFEKMILQPLIDYFGKDKLYEQGTEDKEIHNIQKLLAYYGFYAKEPLKMTAQEREDAEFMFGYFTDNLQKSDRDLNRVLNEYPIVDRLNVYVFDPKASATVIERCEQIILTYCPDYTYEELDYDHSLTEYESDDENPPVFRMALEYKIDANTGLVVRLPANGIRFNESLYTLSSITVLPYMGAGSSAYEGYNFFPDGSGAIFDFKDLHKTNSSTVVGKVYGRDFAYHEISGTYQKTIRYPVFGSVEETKYYEYYTVNAQTGEADKLVGSVSGAIYDAVIAYANGETTGVCKGSEETLFKAYSAYLLDNTGKYIIKEVDRKHGFAAIIEEGDALASLSTYHAGSIHDYNTIMMSFTPRPKDTYNLKDSISVADNSEWTVVSDRKYVGGYTVRYFMLSNPANAAEGTNVYDASWLGMAKVYRDYLTENGVIAPLQANEIKNDIPLYIETFGTIETTEKIMSIPVTVMAPLTTFEDIVTMYDQLKADGIKNINFKLTGYTNGGMEYTVPTKLKFEKAVGGNKGFQELLNKANEINTDKDPNTNLGIYPDFNLVFALDDDWFDGFSWNKHCGKTIDDRYAARKEYSATQQKYENFYETVISPAYFYVLYEKLTKNYAEKYENIQGISVSTLGSWLNSDFDEDEPYNREDSKQFTKDAFEYLDKTYKQVMTDGGNAYVWNYVDHMLNVSLDSSRYSTSANAVPFIGVVLHGSVSFAGEPLNMEGDLKYAILKAIENGASPYFILSMQNTQALKDTDFSRYYSIRYDIWSKDIADVYNKLNGVLGDVQDKFIIGHEFLENGTRVPDAGELREDILNIYNQILNNNINASEIMDKEQSLAVSAARELVRNTLEFLVENKEAYNNSYAAVLKNIAESANFDKGYYQKALEVNKAYYKAGILANNDSADADFAIATAVRASVRNYNSDVNTITKIAEKLYKELRAELNVQREAALKAFLAQQFEKQEDSWVEKLVYSMDISAQIKDILIEYENAESADIDEKVTAIAAIAANKAEVEAYLKTKYTEATDSAISSLADQIVAISDAEANLKEVVASYLINDSASKITDENKAEFDAMVAAVKAIAGDSAAVETYLEGRKEAYANIIDDLAADLVKVGVDDSKIMSCFVKYGTQYTYRSTIIDTIIEVINASDNGRDEYAKLYVAYNNAYVTFEKAKESFESAKAASEAAPEDAAKLTELANAQKTLDAAQAAKDKAYADLENYKTLYGAMTDAFNKYNAGELALDLAESTNAKYEDVYDVILALENVAMFEDIYVEGANITCPELEAGYNAFVAANEAYATAVEGYEKVTSAGYVDRYIYAKANYEAITSAEIGYDCDADAYNYHYLAFVLFENDSYSRMSAISEAADIKNRNYHEIRINYQKAAKRLAEIEVALEVIKAAEENRNGDLESSKVWAEAQTLYAQIKELVAEYKVIYDEVVAGVEGKPSITDAAIAKVKELVAETKLDDAYAADLDAKIASLVYEEEEEKEPEQEIVIENSTKYNTKNIVAVTYGTKEGKAYKTVILNYNNYTVCVEYNGMEYTIPPYEYAEIKLS